MTPLMQPDTISRRSFDHGHIGNFLENHSQTVERAHASVIRRHAPPNSFQALPAEIDDPGFAAADFDPGRAVCPEIRNGQKVPTAVRLRH